MRRGPALFAVLLLPALFLRRVDGVVFGDEAAGPEVVRDFFEDILQFQPVRELGRDGPAAKRLADTKIAKKKRAALCSR